MTLLTRPGLDDIVRLAGMIAILFSTSGMVSAVTTLFKYKADMERAIVYVGSEKLMVTTVRISVLPPYIEVLTYVTAPKCRVSHMEHSRLHHWYHLLLVQRCYPYDQDCYQAAVHRLYTLDSHWRFGQPRQYAPRFRYPGSTPSSATDRPMTSIYSLE